MQTVEKVVRLFDGVDTYNPDVSSDSLAFKRLKNVSPRGGRWQISTRGDIVGQLTLSESDKVEKIAYYSHPYYLFSQLYAITTKYIYLYDFENGTFFATPIYTFAATGDSPVAVVPWYDKLYITKRNCPLLRVEFATVTEVDTSGAKYGIVSNNHLMLACLSTRSGDAPIMIRWSDLYEPEKLLVESGSEADFFELEPQDKDITGLTNQKGIAYVYTRSAIWTASYSAGAYQFQPLYSDVGNLFHGAVVQVKDRDYFIGEDNFYMLDGTALSPIGDGIWSFFKSVCAFSNPQEVVYPIVRKGQEEISWVFKTVTGTYWSVVFNYKEGRWSDRDPEDVLTSINAQFSLKGVMTFADLTGVFDDYTEEFNGDWQYYTSNLAKVAMTKDGTMLDEATVKYSLATGSNRVVEIESVDLYAGSLTKVKEVNRINFHFSGLGAPALSLLVGTRKTRFEAITWSSAILLSNQVAGQTSFCCRAEGVGKILRFKLLIENNDTNYVSELTAVSFDYVNDDTSNPEV